MLNEFRATLEGMIQAARIMRIATGDNNLTPRSPSADRCCAIG